MALRPIRLDRYSRGVPIVDENGVPTMQEQAREQRNLEAIETAVNGIIDAQNAADAANVAAAAANTAAEAAQTAADTAIEAAAAAEVETSLVNSFVKNFAGASPLEADSAGNVTIKSHERHYGNGILHPFVNLSGSLLATAAAPTATVRIFYDDMTFSNETPIFGFTTDPADPPVQGGIRHVIGAVEIPAAGTSDGGYVRSPGYTDIQP